MSSHKKFLFSVIAMTAILSLISCKNQSTNKTLSNASTIISLKNDDVKVALNNSHSEITFHLGDLADIPDTLDASNILAANMLCNYSKDATLIRFEARDALPIEAYKETFFYPTLWATDQMDCIQFIYLFDLGYKQVEQLQINSAGILYPDSPRIDEATIDNLNQNLVKDRMISSIQNVPKEYEQKNTPLIYESENWMKESKSWQKLSTTYKKGMLGHDEERAFCIDPYEVTLRVTFSCSNGEEVTKYFTGRYCIGN